MHAFLTLLALTGLTLDLTSASADPAKARVTTPPSTPPLFRRQDGSSDVCPEGDYTMCPDGFGCCERGAPCTTIRGEPACDTECSGLPCGDSGLCCDGTCTRSLGSAICLVGGLDFPTLTATVDEDGSSTSGSVTSTGSSFDGDEEDETTTTMDSETESETETETETETSTSTRSTTSTVTENDVIPGETGSADDEDDTSSAAPTQTLFNGGDDGSVDTGSNPDEPGAATGLSVSYALTAMVVGLIGGAAILL
ncbi:uncharacterized protein DSM5745_10455 [Aspergillus mulundensis]|uniref:GPI anchored protein n=1 Tax=Aspergillus mulundensis TaxID=1810919 RepID=A0A3D8QIY1_9EURO|nr:hypothetical protein DSM5745_10455 [Aspergillus mulundensis]RDW61783.1 hypothetical protein DSM5745_10455 [Aspergillus mulundensis]